MSASTLKITSIGKFFPNPTTKYPNGGDLACVVTENDKIIHKGLLWISFNPDEKTLIPEWFITFDKNGNESKKLYFKCIDTSKAITPTTRTITNEDLGI